MCVCARVHACVPCVCARVCVRARSCVLVCVCASVHVCARVRARARGAWLRRYIAGQRRSDETTKHTTGTKHKSRSRRKMSSTLRPGEPRSAKGNCETTEPIAAAVLRSTEPGERTIQPGATELQRPSRRGCCFLLSSWRGKSANMASGSRTRVSII